MKRCPECRRDYYDDSLLYCLDDGTALLEGPALANEGKTAIFLPLGAERPTELLDSNKNVDPRRGRVPKAALFAAVVLGMLALAFGGYWFYARSTKQIESIAVLPFENASGNADLEYLSDGITESLINSLLQLPGLKVIARASVFRYKGTKPDIGQVAKDLGVRAVMTGRIIQRGDALDVSVEVIDAKDNAQLWGQHFTRKANDIFAVQDEIARQVTDALRLRLTGAQEQQVTKRYTESPDAYRLYLQGRYLLNEQNSEEGLKTAAAFFDQAIALDPRYALAYAARAETYFLMGDLNLSMNDARARIQPDISTALSIDDSLEQALMVRANMEFQYDWDFQRAEADFKKVIQASPNYAEAHHQYAFYLALTGRFTEAQSEIEKAEQLDPVNPSIVVDTNIPFTLSGQYDLSIARSRKATEMFPNFFLGHMTLGVALCLKGDCAAGAQELEKARELEPGPIVLGELGYVYGKAGRVGDARKIIADLQEQSKTRYVAPWFTALIHVGLGENDEAFPFLEKAYEDHSWWLLWIKTDHRFDPLRSDPRFMDLVRRVHYP
jgi:TolB-like protein/Tfp pilus assembly protein PilF